ncbi:hypothetical protein ABK040_006823 [Willaertia magna]
MSEEKKRKISKFFTINTGDDNSKSILENACAVDNNKKKKKLNTNGIDGLMLFEDFLTESEEKELIKEIEKHKWNSELSRRTQHYGYVYDYSSRNLNEKTKGLEITELFTTTLQKIKERVQEIENIDFNQVIINEYKGTNQGISKHVDHCTAFGAYIVILSLNEDCVMKFHKLKKVDEDKLRTNSKVKREATGEIIDVILRKRSLAILSKDARYQFQHEIPKSKTFKVDVAKLIDIQKEDAKKHITKYRNIVRDDDYRRISITFRSVE